MSISVVSMGCLVLGELIELAQVSSCLPHVTTFSAGKESEVWDASLAVWFNLPCSFSSASEPAP